jgi:hypothetical protein
MIRTRRRDRRSGVADRTGSPTAALFAEVLSARLALAAPVPRRYRGPQQFIYQGL